MAADEGEMRSLSVLPLAPLLTCVVQYAARGEKWISLTNVIDSDDVNSELRGNCTFSCSFCFTHKEFQFITECSQ